MGDHLYAVFQKGDFVQAFTSEWSAKDFIDCNVDCGRADYKARKAEYEVRVYTTTGETL